MSPSAAEGREKFYFAVPKNLQDYFRLDQNWTITLLTGRCQGSEDKSERSNAGGTAEAGGFDLRRRSGVLRGGAVDLGFINVLNQIGSRVASRCVRIQTQTGMMASPLKSLVHDDDRYQKSFQLFLERSSEHQCMRDFIHNKLPDILSSIGDGKSHLNIIGVGSGAGDIDLEMLTELHKRHPEVTVDNEVVEPSSQQLHNYKVLVSQKPELNYIKFTWNKMTASEFEEHWKLKKMTKKADFIHMIQMLYYVKDPGATISFFQGLLDKNGKLLIILVSGESGWGKLWRKYRNELCNTEISQCVTTGDIKTLLDSKGVSYQSFDLPSQMDITECFTEGDEKGELLLDFLTEVLDFSKVASPELKAGVLELLRHPGCSKESDGKVIFNNNLGVIVINKPI